MRADYPKPPYPVNPDVPDEGLDYPDNRNNIVCPLCSRPFEEHTLAELVNISCRVEDDA